MFSAKIIAVGNSLGILLPREALSRMKLEKGDQVFMTETAEGYELSPYDPTFASQVAHLKEVSVEERDLIRGITHVFAPADRSG